MGELLQCIVVIEAVLFIFGFLYGMMEGNPDMGIILRSLCGGLFFMFFYIGIPLTLIFDR